MRAAVGFDRSIDSLAREKWGNYGESISNKQCGAVLEEGTTVDGIACVSRGHAYLAEHNAALVHVLNGHGFAVNIHTSGGVFNRHVGALADLNNDSGDRNHAKLKFGEHNFAMLFRSPALALNVFGRHLHLPGELFATGDAKMGILPRGAYLSALLRVAASDAFINSDQAQGAGASAAAAGGEGEGAESQAHGVGVPTPVHERVRERLRSLGEMLGGSTNLRDVYTTVMLGEVAIGDGMERVQRGGDGSDPR